MSIGEDLAAELIRQLPKQDAQRILAVISRLGKVEDKVVDQVQQDFIALLAAASKFKVGDKHFAKNILLKAFGAEQADNFLDSLPNEIPQSFKDAEHVDAKALQQILAKELPQTITIILAHLSPKKSGEVISHFQANVRSEILLRMATLQEVDHALLDEIDGPLGASIEALRRRSVTQIGGIDKTAALLATMNATQREDLLEKLALTQPEVAEAIRAQLWTFEDLAKIQPADIEKILRKVAASDLELALRQASDTLKARIFKAMSERRAQDLKEAIALGKPTQLTKIEEAQRRIATLASNMIQDGEIVDPSEKAV